MSDSPTSKEIARVLKEISSSLKDQNRILRSIQLALSTEPPPSSEPVEVPPLGEELRVYGWSMAHTVQREGGLKVGDMKVEQDDSCWIWIGDGWERTEMPRGSRAPY